MINEFIWQWNAKVETNFPEVTGFYEIVLEIIFFWLQLLKCRSKCPNGFQFKILYLFYP